MTEPRNLEPDREAQTHAGREPEVRPEVIQDLDMPDDDADIIAGGCKGTNNQCVQSGATD
jgi:hypothetical protein